MPGKDIPHISFLELLEFDKFVHASVFFILVYFLVKAYQKSISPRFKKNSLLFAFSLALGYGGLLEILQGFVFIDRSADVLDFIANSFGAMLAVLWFRKYRLKETSAT